MAALRCVIATPLKLILPLFSALLAGLSPSVLANDHGNKSEWLELFNGRNLDQWTAKITGQPLGQDRYQTFSVSDGLLKVRYHNYDAFDGQFGHLFYAQPFGHYELLIEYRFVGAQVSGGPAWAERNSGVMLHAQEPSTMTLDQDFPNSIEAQFLGGLSDNKPRPTGSVCSPGTEIMLDDALATAHCTYSSSATYDGEQWVQMRIVVNGHDEITHSIGGTTVMRYHSPQLSMGALGPGNKTPLMLDRGYIALQSESHPVDFRRVALRPITP